MILSPLSYELNKTQQFYSSQCDEPKVFANEDEV
jgi:hypothetical protein